MSTRPMRNGVSALLPRYRSTPMTMAVAMSRPTRGVGAWRRLTGGAGSGRSALSLVMAAEPIRGSSAVLTRDPMERVPGASISQATTDDVGAFVGRESRRVDFQVIDAVTMDLILPAADGIRRGHRRGPDRVSLRRDTAREDHLERTAHRDEEHRQTIETPRARGKDPERSAVRIVVADVDHDVQTVPGVRGDRVVQRTVRRHD